MRSCFVIVLLWICRAQVSAEPAPAFLDKIIWSLSGIGSYFLFSYVKCRLDGMK